MIRLLADENMVGLADLGSDELEIRSRPGRQICSDDLLGMDALWVRSVTRVDATLLGSCPLRFVGTATAGLEHIDIAALQARKIHFAAAPGANANAVVEYVIAALLQLQTPWERLEAGAVLGVVGYGEVGRRLVAFANTMGWTVRVSDPWVEHEAQVRSAGSAGNHADAAASSNSGFDAAASTHFVPFEQILACDVISLHCALHTSGPWPSRHLLDAPALARLDGSQWLINAARGEVIDNAALLRRLQGVNPPNVVVDVWEGEPCFDARLLHCEALRLATPHIAGYSWDAKWQASGMLYTAMRDAGLVRGELPGASESAPALTAPASAGGQGWHALMQQSYCIADDDRRFRALAVLAENERAAAFDGLRRHYRVRRELRGRQLRGLPQDVADPRVVPALGLCLEK